MARSNAAQSRPPVRELPSAPAGAYDNVSELLGVVVEHERCRGRGAQSNASGRYEPLARVAASDLTSSVATCAFKACRRRINFR